MAISAFRTCRDLCTSSSTHLTPQLKMNNTDRLSRYGKPNANVTHLTISPSGHHRGVVAGEALIRALSGSSEDTESWSWCLAQRPVFKNLRPKGIFIAHLPAPPEEKNG